MSQFFYYLLAINIYSFVLFGIDKYKARKGYWRVPEKTLFLLSLFGGGLGVYCAMHLFRHKTKHRLFTIGVPVILFLHIVLLVVYLFGIDGV